MKWSCLRINTQAPPPPPRQSLRRGRQKSIPPQDSYSQKWRAQISARLNEFTRSNTKIHSKAQISARSNTLAKQLTPSNTLAWQDDVDFGYTESEPADSGKSSDKSSSSRFRVWGLGLDHARVFERVNSFKSADIRALHF